MAINYYITIDGEDRTLSILNKSVKINDADGSSASTMTLEFLDRDELGLPQADEEIIVVKNDVKLFGGFVLKIDPIPLGGATFRFKLTCVDYTRGLDRRLVVEAYQNMTDRAIIKDIVDNYCQYDSITANDFVDENITINQIAFNYSSPSECISKIAKLSQKIWYIDYDKKIHFFSLTENPAPFDIDSTSANFEDLKITKTNANIRNRVYVRGGSKLSDSTTISMKADGTMTAFNLPYKPHDLTMTVDSVSKTVGIKNVDDSASYDFLMNYQEKVIEAANYGTPASGKILAFTFKYDIPILVAVEDTPSIIDIGPFEYVIIDKTITTTESARARASAELVDYGRTLIDGSFTTIVDGFKAGQYMNINRSELGINDDYLVQSVSASSQGGGIFKYTVKIVSAKKLGIIKFLVNLLEQNKNAVELSSDEVVDELFTLTAESTTITDGTPTLTSVEPPYLWGSFEWGFGEWS